MKYRIFSKEHLPRISTPFERLPRAPLLSLKSCERYYCSYYCSYCLIKETSWKYFNVVLIYLMCIFYMYTYNKNKPSNDEKIIIL